MFARLWFFLASIYGLLRRAEPLAAGGSLSGNLLMPFNPAPVYLHRLDEKLCFLALYVGYNRILLGGTER
jgi:hypothetical protein